MKVHGNTETVYKDIVFEIFDLKGTFQLENTTLAKYKGYEIIENSYSSILDELCDSAEQLTCCVYGYLRFLFSADIRSLKYFSYVSMQPCSVIGSS